MQFIGITIARIFMSIFFFSERETKCLEPKVYKKDIWHDKDTHKLAKANSENAVLVHKKGEVQRDKEVTSNTKRTYSK